MNDALADTQEAKRLKDNKRRDIFLFLLSFDLIDSTSYK